MLEPHRVTPTFNHLSLLLSAWTTLIGCTDTSMVSAPRDAASQDLQDVHSTTNDATSDRPDSSPPNMRDANASSFPATDEITHYFEDVTLRSGITWEREPIDEMNSFADRFTGGLCAIDADGEGPLDLFFPARGLGQSRLFLSSAPLHYEDGTVASGLNAVTDAVGCLAYDADGDRDDDLLVMGMGNIQYFTNDGGRFTWQKMALQITVLEDVLYTSAAAGDLDEDGDLDVVIAGSFRINPELAPDLVCVGGVPCSADVGKQLGASNFLLIRDGERYSEQSESLAPAMLLNEPTLIVSIGRITTDDTVAIYIGNDLGARYQDRVLVRSPRGIYRDNGVSIGLATNWQGHGIDTMGMTSIDMDRDGRLEHVVTAFEGYMTSFFDCDPGYCEDMARTTGFRETEDTFRWSPVFIDVNLDGWADLFEASGHYYRGEELTSLGFASTEAQAPNFYLNPGTGAFEVHDPSPEDALAVEVRGRGAIRIDLDDDGLPDIAAIGTDGRPQLLRNAVPRRHHFINVQLEGTSSNTRAIGALVEVNSGGDSQLQEARAGEGYLSSFDRRLFFGLGNAESASIIVRWPNGRSTVHEVTRENIDRTLIISEDSTS